MTIRRHLSIGIVGLAIGYFAFYTPYSGLAKALSSGLLPGMGAPSGFVLLPAVALGTLLAMVAYLVATGAWRHAGRREVGGVAVPFPSRHMLAASFWMALIMGATTLNFTFPGVSILFMLLVMRIARLLISPSIDLVRGRHIPPWSWTASGLALISALVAFADVNNYQLSLVAIASLGAYVSGYVGRFEIMSKHAKQGRADDDRRYLVEEQIGTPVLLVALLAVLAVIGAGPLADLRTGFTSFLASPAAVPALLVGALYGGLWIFTTRIYLDKREYTFVMPVSVAASLAAGVASSLALSRIFGIAPPSTAQFVSTGIILMAVCACAYPAFAAWLRSRRPVVPVADAGRRLLLFVCGGNTCRSAMAEQIARAELALAGRNGDGPRVLSAGISAEAGAPMTPEAERVLHELDVPIAPHRSRRLTAEDLRRAEAVYCMTRAQRDAALALAPEAAARIVVLDPDADIPDPIGKSTGAYRDCALRIQALVRTRVTPRLVPVPGG